MIQIKNLSRKFGRFKALDGVDLTLEPGRIIGLVGPNGSGKTTLLKIIGAFDQRYEGEIFINGKEPGEESRAEVSFLSDFPCLPEYMSAQKLVDTYSRMFDDFDANKATKMIEFFQIDLKKKLRDMSKGMQEKVQIALTMSRRAKIYVLDEPISGVDPVARKMILQGILRDFDESSMMILSTHLIQDIEPILDEVVFIGNGKIIEHTSADAIRTEHSKSVNEYFEEVFS